VSRFEVDLEIGPFPYPADIAERLTGAVPEDAPDIAFGANLHTGMVGVSAAVEAESPNAAVLVVMYTLGRTVAGAHIEGMPRTFRASAEAAVPA
jgi:hypothetical protein